MFAYAKRRCTYDCEDDSEDSIEETCSEESSDSPVSNDDGDNNNASDPTPLKEELLKVLTHIQKNTSCEFAVGKASQDLTPLPGIRIDGYGNVSLPITARNVEDLKKNFQQAPYGLGEATLIDKAVRDSWQLDPEKFEITNPQFNAGVDKLVKEVKNALGCSELNVTSHLYKLLLYESGGHFKPHRDTEKHPGMFATLIIQVPSIFTGGDLVVKHNSQEKRVIFSSGEAAFQCIYAAHYADCEHELTEITSGYRMALVYSLCWNGNGVVPSPPDVPTNNLADLLKQIDQIVPNPGMVAWALDHQYSENALLQKGAEALKGSDKLLYSSLQGANELLDEEKKLEFFLVEATRTDNMSGDCTAGYGRWGWGGCTGDCFELTGDTDTEYEYKVIGVDGHKWDRSLAFELNVRQDVLNGKSKSMFWGECHEGECSGPSGNEGAEKSNWYCRYVLVMFPKENAVKVVYKNSAGSGINYLRKELDKKGALSVKKLAHDIVDICIAKKKDLCNCKEDVIALLNILMEMKETELLQNVLQMLANPFLNYYPSNYSHYYSYNSNSSTVKVGFGFPSEEMVDVIKELMAAFGGLFTQEVATLVRTSPASHFKHVQLFLQQCPDSIPKDELIRSAVQNAVSLQGGLPDDIVIAVGQVILSNSVSYGEFVKAFLNVPNLQSLKMMNSLLSLWADKECQDLNTNEFYRSTFAKFWEMMQQYSQGAKPCTSQSNIEAFITGTEYLINRHETSKFNSLVDDVMKLSNQQLMKALLTSRFCQSATIAGPVKYLIQARVNQLKYNVQVVKPIFSWCLPKVVVPNYPEIQEFMRGPLRNMVYSNFNSRKKADKFRRECKSYLGDVEIRIVGTLKETTVNLSKSLTLKAKHDAALKQYREKHDELRRLEAKLSAKPDVICL